MVKGCGDENKKSNEKDGDLGGRGDLQMLRFGKINGGIQYSTHSHHRAVH